MVQLSDWITTLEPHFTEVWRMQAWNMAYNISVKCKDFEERWRWVQRGIVLLHKGLKYNPGDSDIYRDLSWFFRHKIGQNLDDAHMLYKIRWAQQMQDVLGGRPDFAALLNPRPRRTGNGSGNCARIITWTRPSSRKSTRPSGRWTGACRTPTPFTGRNWACATGRRRTRTSSAATPTPSCSRPVYAAAPCLVGHQCHRGKFHSLAQFGLVPTVNAAYERTMLEIRTKRLVLTAQKNFLKAPWSYCMNKTAPRRRPLVQLLEEQLHQRPDGDETNSRPKNTPSNKSRPTSSKLDPNKATVFILGQIARNTSPDRRR